MVKVGQCTDTDNNPISCLAQIRTNEIEINSNGIWEQRQFELATNASGQPVLNMATVSMTPDSSFDFFPGEPSCGQQIRGIHPCNDGLFMKSWIDDNQTEILATDGALPVVTSSVMNNNNQTAAFLGGSAFNGPQLGNAFWLDMEPTNSEQARSDFSLNTCDGCHGTETATPVLHVNPRFAGTTSALSDFLLGCVPNTGSCALNNPGPQANSTCSNGQCNINTPGTVLVNDPNDQSIQNKFGDILRRQTYIDGLISSGPGSGGMLLPFLAQPIGVH